MNNNNDNTNTKLEANTTAIAVIQNDMNYIKTQLDTLVRSLGDLRIQFAAKNEVQNLEQRVNEMEAKWASWTTWIVKLIGGIIIAGLLALLMTRG